MLIYAWICMGCAIFVGGLLLGDLKREMEYDKMIQKKHEGDHYGLQETVGRQSGELLRRCG